MCDQVDHGRSKFQYANFQLKKSYLVSQYKQFLSKEVPELTKICIVLQGKNAVFFSKNLLQKLAIFVKYIMTEF